MFGVDELGMDLGTSTLHIVVRGKGIVLSEPAYVAYDRQTRNVVAVGEEARRMYGRTPAGLIVERPLRDGRIRSFDLVSKMLRYFMRKVIGKRATFRPKLLLALPGGMAPSERQTLVDVLVDAGVRSVVPVDESVASAIGAGMRIDQPYGRMNIDIGGGRTNVSVFSFGHQIVWDILNVGGDRFDDAIIDYLRKKHNLLIGARTAEELKIDIGSARMRGVKLEMDACGRSLVSGLPRAVTVSSEEMIEALDEPLRDLMSALHRMIERTPPELASDIFDEGITLSGGGAHPVVAAGTLCLCQRLLAAAGKLQQAGQGSGPGGIQPGGLRGAAQLVRILFPQLFQQAGAGILRHAQCVEQAEQIAHVADFQHPRGPQLGQALRCQPDRLLHLCFPHRAQHLKAHLGDLLEGVALCRGAVDVFVVVVAQRLAGGGLRRFGNGEGHVRLESQQTAVQVGEGDDLFRRKKAAVGLIQAVLLKPAHVVLAAPCGLVQRPQCKGGTLLGLQRRKIKFHVGSPLFFLHHPAPVLPAGGCGAFRTQWAHPGVFCLYFTLSW